MKKVVIISAVNLIEGGPLIMLRECLGYLSSSDLSKRYEIVAIVHNKELCPFDNINYIELSRAKKSWINRLYYEYRYFNKLAKRYNPFLWLSLHDVTPNVSAERIAVYCHNASPFYRLQLKEAIMSPRFTLFNILYKYIYAINMENNNFVIVQQDWMRQSFSKLFKIDINKIIVAHPTINTAPFVRNKIRIFDFKNDFIFFYPSLSRVFKNHEVICKASEILIKQKISNFKVIFTIAGNENQYSRYIYNSFKHLKNIVFMESQSWENTLNLCSAADCVIFPSKLETWGIPITEAKLFMKPILLADLEYAHETLGKYDKARFFNPENHKQLSDLMKAMIDGTIVYEKTESRVISEPFSRDWNELFNILLK